MNGRTQRLIRHLCVPVLTLTLLLPRLVVAQGASTLVYLDPSAAQVEAGQTTSVDVVVGDTSNLYGVEVHLVFDPEFVEVVDADPGQAGVQVSLGPFLDVGFVAVNEVDPGTGRIDFAYSQSPGLSGVSGSGTIATITFRGLQPGVSPLSFVAVLLADEGGNEIAVETQNGQVTVPGGEPPTPTPTATPTESPTPPAGAALSFVPATAYVNVGSTVEVRLHVANASNLYGVEVHLTHPDGINAIGIEAEPCINDVVPPPSLEGNRIDYAASLQAPSAPVEGECDLASITIQGLEVGTYPLEFTSALLSDPNGNPLDVTTYDGTIVVSGPTETPSPTPPPDCGDILGYHVVQPGETLYAIGRAYGVRPDAIARCNSIINPNLIYAGTTLAIPNVPWFPIPPGPVARRQFGDGTSLTCRFYHTVQWGESLFRISLRYGVSMWAIAEANTIYNLHYIRAGEVLCIPQGVDP